MEKSCVIVYRSGRYRREQKTQKLPGAEVKTQIFEAAVSPQAIEELRQILDDPKLQQRHTQDPPNGIAVQEMEYVSVSIPRPPQVQKLDFWRYFGAFHYGAAGMPVTEEQGMKQFKPLGQWLKVNVEDQKINPIDDVAANGCQSVSPPTP
jgi:hypothetical protein